MPRVIKTPGTGAGRAGGIFMLPFATEDKGRPRHWFASVSEPDQDAVIVLCEEEKAGSRKIYAVELFLDFMQEWRSPPHGAR
jgi:hypothetical protein